MRVFPKKDKQNKYEKEFIASHKIDKKYGRILRNAFRNKTKGYYDAFIEFGKDEVEEMYSVIIDFISAIEKVCIVLKS